MGKLSQKSLIDILIDQLGPNVTIIRRENSIDARAAHALYDIWKDSRNHVSGKVYRKPNTVSKRIFESMQKEGLVREIGDRLEVTAKGAEVIRTMILGDDRSVWEDDGKPKEYRLAYEHTKTPSMKKKAKQHESFWWGQNKVGQALDKMELEQAANRLKETIMDQSPVAIGIDVLNQKIFVHLRQKPTRPLPTEFEGFPVEEAIIGQRKNTD